MKRVLITNVDPETLFMLRDAAEASGCDVLVLEDFAEFEAACRLFKPDLVVLDPPAQATDGVDALACLAGRRSNASVLFVGDALAPASINAERRANSLGIRVDGVLARPVDPAAAEVEFRRHQRDRGSEAGLGEKITEADLANAIERDELLLHYQPLVALGTRRVTGVEALVRWAHPELGLVGPDNFIPLAERTGLIFPLTFWVLERVTAEMSAVQIDARPVDVSLILSRRLLGDLGLPNRLDDVLRSREFARDRLILEVTETGIMEDPNRSMDILARLCLKSIRLSIDDFGTGSSSLLQLYRLPYSEIKIDRSFVQSALVSDEAAVIVKSTVSLGKNLGLRVVAEGIEHEEMRVHMRDLGCDVAQGFLICRPLPAADLRAWLSRAASGEVDPGGGGSDRDAEILKPGEPDSDTSLAP
ncbi:MAG: EAL domain-containing response regulator [Gammaproteobacteria bacterium]|nr:EAL domain-containing response regulator [Gammaproteobacteria bacterium]